MIRAVIVAALALASPSAAQPLGDPGEWLPFAWQGSLAGDALLDIDLIRGDVYIEPSRDEARVRIVPSSGGADAAIVVVKSAAGVSIRDRYPRRSMMADECLPPPDERGDYATSTTRLVATIALPPGRRLRVHVMDGDIHVGAVSGELDLSSNGGKVIRAPAR